MNIHFKKLPFCYQQCQCEDNFLNVSISACKGASYNTFPRFFPLFLVTTSMLKSSIISLYHPFAAFSFCRWQCTKKENQNEKLYLVFQEKWKLKLLKPVEGFPGGAVVENLPANAEDTGSSPGLGRSHMPRSNWAREPQLLSLSVWSLCSSTREAAIVRGPRTAMKSGPRLPQLEKTLAQKRRPNTAKNK